MKKVTKRSIFCCYHRMPETGWLIRSRSLFFSCYGGWDIWECGSSIFLASTESLSPHHHMTEHHHSEQCRCTSSGLSFFSHKATNAVTVSSPYPKTSSWNIINLEGLTFTDEFKGYVSNQTTQPCSASSQLVSCLTHIIQSWGFGETFRCKI